MIVSALLACQIIVAKVLTKIDTLNIMYLIVNKLMQSKVLYNTLLGVSSCCTRGAGCRRQAARLERQV